MLATNYAAIALALIYGTSSRANAEAPYAASPVIARIEWAPAKSIVRKAAGGDNWPLTWADDDALYTAWGDGTGFEPGVGRKLGMGFARIIGSSDTFRGENIRSSGEELGHGRTGKKAWGILCINGVLYMAVGHADRKGSQSQLAWSHDHAKTWTFADWTFDRLGLLGFVNYGRNYDGARDHFVYAFSHDGPRADTPADRFVLLRVAKDRIATRDAWEFIERLDGDKPVWTREFARRSGVFKNPDGCLRSAMTYNPGLKRYLWWQQIPAPRGSEDRGDTRFKGGFAVYDARQPWGPWTTAYHTEHWDVGPGEHGDFPSKWMSADGRELCLVFSGNDAFSVRDARIVLREPGNPRK